MTEREKSREREGVDGLSDGRVEEVDGGVGGVRG